MVSACPQCKSRFAGGEVFCPVDGTRLRSYSTDPEKVIEDADPLIGIVFGDRYRILRRIGEGGMGVVYEAEHLLIENRVAIKVLRFELRLRNSVVERFRQEAKSASHIGHPNIVSVSDFGETPDGCFYYVMEMLEGVDLAEILYIERALPPVRAVRLVVQCCRALGAAHSKGIVHRDVKPENIFVMQADGADFVKIVDFGVAKMNDVEMPGKPGRKLTKTGMIFGTPEYMAPEHAMGKSLDHRADIYALGVILYETLTGWLPFEGDNFMEVLHKHANQPLLPLREKNPFTRVSPELETAIFRALEKDPNKRFQTMDEMAKALLDTPEMLDELKRGLTDLNPPSQAAPQLVSAASAARLERRSSVQTTVHLSAPAERSLANRRASAPEQVATVRPATDEKAEGERVAVRSESRPEGSFPTPEPLMSMRRTYGRGTKIAVVSLSVAACAALVALADGRLSAPGGATNASSAGHEATAHVDALSKRPGKSHAKPRATTEPANASEAGKPSASTRQANEPTQTRTSLSPSAISAPQTSSVFSPAKARDKQGARPLAVVTPRDNGTRDGVTPLIAVRAVTVPKGARLTILGRGKVCESTPCEFETPSDKEITLLAELDGVKTLETIRPKVSTSVSIALYPAAAVKVKSPEIPVVNPRPVTDLKTPDIFR
jgi:serine/threonine protein kinase